jgi:hypothetical protein
VDGTKVQQLCDFLLKVLKIKEIGQLSEATTFELIFPHCREELLGAVEQAIRDGKDFEHFPARILRQFIPSRQMAQIRRAMYERVRKEGESFSRYIQAIRHAAKFLRIQESETQIVQRIIEGNTPNQRARFVFQTVPSSFKRLENLVIVDRNIEYADQNRKASRLELRQTTEAARKSQSNLEGSPSSRANVYYNKGAVTCFYCQKKVHIQSMFVEITSST